MHPVQDVHLKITNNIHRYCALYLGFLWCSGSLLLLFSMCLGVFCFPSGLCVPFDRLFYFLSYFVSALACVFSAAFTSCPSVCRMIVCTCPNAFHLSPYLHPLSYLSLSLTMSSGQFFVLPVFSSAYLVSLV